MIQKVLSPLTQKEARHIKSIEPDKLIADYKRVFNIDVSGILKDVKSISIYECLDSGYKFFHPENISGDATFYEELQAFEWYYMPWKWEHENASKFISKNDKVLEIGCAEGEFLLRNKEQKNISGIGLELNSKAIENAIKKNIEVHEQTIQLYAQSNQSAFDISCSFQVVEHISDIKSFIEAQILTIKKGGRLIISVPNNDGFLGVDSENILNLPPHHMGIWNERSLRFLSRIFPIEFENCYYEPLQSYHHNYFWKVIFKYLTGLNIFPEKLVNKLVSNPKFQGLTLPLFNKRFKAFTIQAVYKKL
jgi:SAM-dependent methyltransferase